ncbi:zinc finger protein 208 isoform X1 [Oncorhynchus tshawytscha]|uniref:zinc finger protein 208 isoform X1 n=2 Tax=Oncorhynchus tshawytscha TaxID=74940 RepID=UPI000D09B511|nr:zinc finger protein 208 isoform X1 [Oncorhynchus tshawytscha]
MWTAVTRRCKTLQRGPILHESSHRGQVKMQKWNNVKWERELGDGGPPFCFSCERIFPDQISFHDHFCPAAGYICSCGTEFSMYVDMMDHSGLHEPGHTVINYSTVKKEQYQREREYKEQLSRLVLTVGQGSWAKPGLTPMLSATMPRPTKPPPGPRAPTTDLWHQFQPVVLVETLRKFGRTKPYRCAYCELGFATKDLLVWHHNTHARNKVHGCLQCGVLLLSNNKSPQPGHHQCGSYRATPETRFTTATVLSNRKQPVGKAQKVVQRPHCPDPFNGELQLGMHMVSQQPVPGTSGTKYLKCRVCQEPFQTVKLLERHRCTMAASFFAHELGLTSGKQLNGHRKGKEGTSPYSFPRRNGDKELAFNIQTSANVTVYDHKAVGPDRGTGLSAISVKTEVSDDDCFVIEDALSC